jgi:hypothetical protein
MEFDRIDQVHFVTLLGKRKSVNSRRAAHVHDHGGCRREITRENRFGAKPLQFASIRRQPLSLVAFQIMTFDFFWEQAHPRLRMQKVIPAVVHFRIKP